MRRKVTHTVYKSESPVKHVDVASQSGIYGTTVQFENGDVVFINIRHRPKKSEGWLEITIETKVG